MASKRFKETRISIAVGALPMDRLLREQVCDECGRSFVFQRQEDGEPPSELAFYCPCCGRRNAAAT